MAADTSGRARACFDLKRTTFPLFSLVLRTTDFAELQHELQARIGQAPDFFDQDLLVLNLSAVQREDNDLDFAALVEMLRCYGLQPIGVHGGSPSQMAAAAEAGLVATPEVSLASSMARAGGSAPPAPASAAARAGDSASRDAGADDTTVADVQRADARGAAVRQASAASSPQASGHTPAASSAQSSAEARARDAEVAATAAAPAAAPPAAAPAAAQPAAAHGNTVVIDKPLRSGQRVYAKNADLVVLETVSFGAEVFADGNVHVYAPLRGRAIAGARGNADARIFTTCLDPQLVAIAGVYRTIETALPDEVAGKPAQIRRVGDSLLIEPL